MKKDANFVDELGLLMQRKQTSARLTPYVTSVKRQYVTARRNTKKLIQKEKNSNEPVGIDEISDQNLDNNLFENLFGIL